MQYLNIRFIQPQTSVHTQLGRLEAHSTPARLSTENRQARSNKGTTQMSIDIDTYESRHSYGFTNHTDFAREHGSKGFSDLQRSTSSHTQEAWANIDGGGKPGRNPVTELYDNRLTSEIKKQRIIVAEHIPDPTITVHPSEVVGTPDEGDVTVNIDTDAFAKTHFTRGSVETYVKQKADVKRWLTEGRYDKYI